MKAPDWSALTGDATAAAKVLADIQRDLSLTADPFEKAVMLLGAETCYSMLGQTEEARQALTQARQIAPEDNPFVQMHADYHEARLCSTEDRFQESLDKFDEMLTKYRQDLKDPDNRYLYEEIQIRLLWRFSKGAPRPCHY